MHALIYLERASSEQSAHTSMKETNLNQFMSAIQLLSGNIQHRKLLATANIN